MATLDPVLDGDSGLEARTKINTNDANINSDVGQNTNDITSLDTAKADRANPSTAGNLAELDASGNVVDSGQVTSGVLINPVDAITFNTSPPVITAAGTLKWNGGEYTIDIITGLGATVQVGQEILLLYYNDTGGPIFNFTTLHPKGAVEISGVIVPTPEIADASVWELCEGTLSVATHQIDDGQLGFATRFGKARDGNTVGLTPGSQLWLSTDGSGLPTIVKPQFPDYSISLGGSLKEDASEGVIFVSVTRSVTDTYNDAWDGAIRETFDFLVASDGAIVTGTLTNINPLNNLTLLFSDGAVFYTLDTTTTPLTIVLTAGTDSLPVTNYVYIPISTKVLTVSSSGFPPTEHCKVAQLEVQSATTVASELGAVRNQNINDHIKKEDDNGHILHIAERIRQLNAEHDNGTEGSLTGTPTNGYIQVTGGEVWQLHKQTFASFSMPTRNIIVVNDFTTPNRRTNNLNTISAYSTGSTWNNEWSKVVVWGIANKTGEPDFVNINLPSAGYNSEANAVSDALNYADYTIPTKYKGVGFLIAAFTVRISGGTITYNGGTAYQDLRGSIPNNIAGGGGGSGVTTLLGLSDVFIASYAGKKGQAVKVNDLETGIDSGGQVVGGSQIVVFSATPTFNFNNGNTQQITLTGNITSWTISDELPAGSYVIYFVQDGTGGWTISAPTGIDHVDTSLGYAVTANDINIVNIIVMPDGTTIMDLVKTIVV